MIALLGRFFRSATSVFRGNGDILAPAAEANDFDTRRLRYVERELLYTNRVYRRAQFGGMLERIFESDLGVPAGEFEQTKVYGYFSPFQAIADVYQHCIPGTWGDPLKIAPKVSGRDVNPALIAPDDPVGKLWRWSNLAVENEQMQYMAANYGTCGIRVVAKDAANAEDRRVFIQFDHPGWICDFDEDSRGNVTEVLLRYKIMQGALGDDDPQEVEVEERIGRERFSKKYNDKEQLPADERVNRLGVCPYVLLRHKARKGYDFGIHAYEGSEGIVHLINQIISRQAKSVYDHAYPNWFASAGGPPPEVMEMGGGKLSYVQTESGAPPPTLEAIVAKLDHNATRAYFVELIDKLRTRQPEMNLNDVELLSHTSAALIAQILKPTEFVVQRARTRYWDALYRAIKIGLSEMIRMGIIDLGTGQSVEAANRAYASGAEDFDLMSIPILPETVIDKTTRIDMETQRRKRDFEDANTGKEFLDEREQLRVAGYDEAQVDAIIQRRREFDVVPQEAL